MKEKTKKRIRGSISIFLVIIMVPMMCLSGLIVDGSRVELAKASVSSAGDLTMNAALANYDTVLKDVYGLFAMSQTAEDLEDNLYDYFVETLMANGIITSEEEVASNPLLQDVAGAFSGKTSNLLSVEVDREDFHATKLKDSSLANTEILKNQIVEYQKYRAPVSSALSLLDGISSLKKILEQSSVNQAKTKVDEKSGDVNDNGKKLYDLLKQYDDKTDSYEPEFDKVKFEDIKYHHSEIYRQIIIPMYVRAMAEKMPFGTGMKEGYRFDRGNSININLKKPKGTAEELGLKVESIYESFGSGTMQDATSFLGMAPSIALLSLRNKRTYATAYEMYMEKVYELKITYDAYKEQYDEEVEEQERQKEEKEKKEQEAQDSVDEENVDGEAGDTESTETSEDTEEIEFEEIYLVDESKILEIYDDAIDFTKDLEEYEKIYIPLEARADAAIQAVNEDVISKIEWFSGVNKILEKAVTQIGKLEDEIKALDDANGNLKKAIDTYNGSDAEDTFSKQMQADYEYYKENIDPEKISVLKERLKKIQTYFNCVETYLRSISFIGFKANNESFTYLDNLVSETENRTLQNGMNNIEYIEANVAGGKDVDWFVREYYRDDFNVEYNNEVLDEEIDVYIKEDPFYQYLQKAYSVEPTEDDKQAKEQKKALKNAAKEADMEGTSSAYNSVTIPDDVKQYLPSQGSHQAPASVEGYGGGDDFSGLFDRITGAVSGLIEGIKQAATNGRDNLYVTQYIFDMFSYNTMEAEFKEENKTEDKTKSLEDLGLSLETSSGIKKSPTNNYMYGAEVEYILYGGTDAEANISSTKSTIFCIRFLANSSYALTNAEIKSITLPPALSVQAATMGVVPYKLTQVVLQLCLALGESANDLRLMEQGKKVALIKTKDTWTLSPSGAITAAKDWLKDEISDAVKTTASNVKGVMSDLINAGAEKIEVKVTDYISDITIAINGQIEELIGSMFSAFEEEVIASLDSYLKQGKDAISNADRVAQDIINSADAKAIEIINNSNATIKPIIKGFYDRYLAPKLGEMKSEVKTALSSIENIEDGATVLLNVQKKIAKMIEDSLTNLSNYVKSQTGAIIGDLESKLIATSDGYIDMAADEILNVTNSFMDDTFDSLAEQLPDVGGKNITTSSSIASIIKFNYGDYLKMFVFLNLCIADVEIISRVADVIQLNINEALVDSGYNHPKKGEFLMSEAYTYVEMDANVRLKTMFISLPFFTDYAGRGGSYFTNNYKSVLGY